MPSYSNLFVKRNQQLSAMQVKKLTKQLAPHTIWRLPFRIRLQENINLKRENQLHLNEPAGKNTRSEMGRGKFAKNTKQTMSN